MEQPTEQQMADGASTIPEARAQIAVAAFDGLSHGVVVLDADGRVLALNNAADELFGKTRTLSSNGRPSTCCALFGCRTAAGALEGGCIARLTRAGTFPDDVRLPVSSSRVDQVWVTTSLIPGDRVAVHLRPVERRASQSFGGDRLRIRALGSVHIAGVGDAPLGGEWLAQRPGQVLKLLLARRERLLAAEEIAEALWVEAGPNALANVRYSIHTLRHRLDPGRSRGKESVVLSRSGGYLLDRRHLDIDADRFSEIAEIGLAAYAAGDRRLAHARLEAAIDVYRGDFIADEPYADWVFAERERLREMAARCLQVLEEIQVQGHDLDAAAVHARQRTELDPYDVDAQRRLILLCLVRGRRSEAKRRYQGLRQRLNAEFGEEPDFTLVDLAEDARSLRMATAS